MGYFFMIKKALVILVGMLFTLQVMASGSVLINGKDIKNHNDLHTSFAKQLSFPLNYRKNLDALYDILSTDYSGESIIKIKHLNLLKAKIGTEYMEAFVASIREAAEENPRIILVLE